MIYLLLSIASSTLIFVVFKLFSKYKVNTLQAIVYNYVIAASCGFISYQETIEWPTLLKSSWSLGAMLLGVLFITVFNLMAWTTQKNGLSVAAVSSKMSVAIPILFGIFIYNESTGIAKIIGMLIAFLAVYFISIKNSKVLRLNPKNLLLPISVFLGSGIIDTSIKYLESKYVLEKEIPLFSATIFLTAALIGLLILSVQVIRGEQKIALKNIIAGIGLGIPNYFSILFLILALRNEMLESSTVFTINNVAILMMSTLLGILFFKERLSQKNWAGFILAIISILLVTYSI